MKKVEMVVMIGERLSGETDLETIRFAIAAYGAAALGCFPTGGSGRDGITRIKCRGLIS